MSYSDFCFVEKRNQVNNLKRWFMYGLILFVIVTILTMFYVKAMYKDIGSCEIQSEYPIEIKIDEAKKTNVNGFIKGNITNKSEEEINGKYIKFMFYNSRNEEIGKEYIEIGTLKLQETKTYELNFKYEKIEKIIITISDSK